MLSPDYLKRVSEGSEEIASLLHNYIIKKIIGRMMARLGRGDEYLFTSSDKWQIQILQDSGALLEEITADAGKRDQSSDGRSRDKSHRKRQ